MISSTWNPIGHMPKSALFKCFAHIFPMWKKNPFGKKNLGVKKITNPNCIDPTVWTLNNVLAISSIVERTKLTWSLYIFPNLSFGRLFHCCRFSIDWWVSLVTRTKTLHAYFLIPKMCAMFFLLIPKSNWIDPFQPPNNRNVKLFQKVYHDTDTCWVKKQTNVAKAIYPNFFAK